MTEQAQNDSGFLSPCAAGVVLAVSAALVLNGVLTVVKESSAPVKTALVGLGGHHWTGHALVLFPLTALLAVVLARLRVGAVQNLTPGRASWLLAGATLAGSVLIGGFYLLH
ncbi:MAG: hypothetical protein PWP23_1843 [Candidatus Sumerlaeota bacterium]|nr:hypothetical protein [Candidatus Sumerlaeota bacterium]